MSQPSAPRSVLARGLSLLDAFGAGDDELSLGELAGRAGLPKPTAHRLAADLVDWGALERTASGGYRLAMKLFRLGQRVPRRHALTQLARPYLAELYGYTRENTQLAVPDGLHTMFVDRISGRASTPIDSDIGSRLPAHCTATGKVFLAFGPAELRRRTMANGLARYTAHTIVTPGLLDQDLRRTLGRGFGFNNEEIEVGVAAVAAPVLGPDGRVVAALSVTGSTRRLRESGVARAVCRAAASLSDQLPAALVG